MQNLPEPDYSFATEAEFVTTKEAIEEKVKETYQAEKAGFFIRKFFKYDNETLEQTNEDFWVHFVVVNSPQMDLSDTTGLFEEGKKIAAMVMKGVSNSEVYDKVQVTIAETTPGVVSKARTADYYYSYPSLKRTQMMRE